MILTKGYLISLILGNVSIDSFLFFVTRSPSQQGSMKRQLATEDLFLGNIDFFVTLKGEKVGLSNGRDCLSKNISSNEHND